MNKRQKHKKKKAKQTAMRSRTVFLNEPPKKETSMHKSILEFLAFIGKGILILFITAIVVIVAFSVSNAWGNPTDWHNNEVSEQISQQAKAEAQRLWREENGDWQPNLTPAAEKELQLYTAQKQVEIDRTLRAKK